MHNTLTRVQTAFGYLTSCAFFLALLVSALSLIPLPLPSSTATTTTTPPSASISVRNIQVVRGRPHYYSAKREEYAHVRFDLEADLSGLFNWNTKQVFVYVNVEYPAEPAERTGLGQDGTEGSLSSGGRHAAGMNKAVIWDTIIPAPATEWSFANVRERYFPTTTKKAGTAKKSTSKSKAEKAKTTATTKDLTKPGLLTLKNQKPKYQITDPSGIISSRPNATLTLSWNLQPWVGPLLWDRGMLEKNGTGRATEGSWNLPFLRHPWRGGVLPRSERFDFPPLKGAQKTSEVVKDEEGPRTPEPAVVSGVV